MKLRIRHPRVKHPDAETTRVRIPLAAASRDEAALADALHMLVELTRDLDKLIENPPELAKFTTRSFYLVTTFHVPTKKYVRERRFFERCVKFPALHPAMVLYARNVNSRARGVQGMHTDLGHSDMRPAGCFAVVPLVLRDIGYVDLLVEHMRGHDMDHETFEAPLIEELLVRHGLCDETLRLLAARAVDLAGQEGDTNLRLAVRRHGLREWLAEAGNLEKFAALVDGISQRKNYRALYVALAGKVLFEREPEQFQVWLAWFEAKGLAFGPLDRELPEPKGDHAPPPFNEDWPADD
jgi:hypothetical protein